MGIATAVRVELAQALSEAGVPAFASMPTTVAPPLVAFLPGEPYVTADRLGEQLYVRVNLTASLIVPQLDSEAAMFQLEDLIDDVFRALPPGVHASEVSAPRVDRLGDSQGAVLIAELDIQAQGKE